MTNTTDRKYRPLVYICSPYSGDTEANIKKAKDFCRYALDQGQIPLAPHLMFPQFMKDANPDERELMMRSWWSRSSQGLRLRSRHKQITVMPVVLF